MPKLISDFSLLSFLSSSSSLASSVSSALQMIDQFIASGHIPEMPAPISPGDVSQHHLAAFSNELRSKELLCHAVDKERVRSLSGPHAPA